MAEMSSSLLSSPSSHINRNVLLLWVVGTILIMALANNVPPVFIFGDSTVDVGTNNYIPTKAKANFPYNGIDFPSSIATGRFSDGYNSADFIVRPLGYKQSPPPFLALLQDNSTFQINLLQGVNFASGGAGILDTTGNQTWGDVITMAQQVQQFTTVQGNITQRLGNKSADFFANSLFFISVGSNDIFDHYRYNEATVSQVQLMLRLQINYTNQLTALYNLGARKFGIMSVPPIGCCPYARLQNFTDSGLSGCLTELNDYAQSFHLMVSDLLHNLSSQLQGMIYSLGDAYTMTCTLMKDPHVVGIDNIEEACCGNGTLNAEQPCYIEDSPNLCPIRGKYLFWDLYHPTEHAAHLTAITLFTGDQSFVAPMNFSQLARAGA